ncbi:hypothetical protein CYMTET_36474, partial [Cymbomonas tetramitiformis]
AGGTLEVAVGGSACSEGRPIQASQGPRYEIASPFATSASTTLWQDALYHDSKAVQVFYELQDEAGGRVVAPYGVTVSLWMQLRTGAQMLSWSVPTADCVDPTQCTCSGGSEMKVEGVGEARCWSECLEAPWCHVAFCSSAEGADTAGCDCFMYPPKACEEMGATVAYGQGPHMRKTWADNGTHIMPAKCNGADLSTGLGECLYMGGAQREWFSESQTNEMSVAVLMTLNEAVTELMGVTWPTVWSAPKVANLQQRVQHAALSEAGVEMTLPAASLFPGEDVSASLTAYTDYLLTSYSLYILYNTSVLTFRQVGPDSATDLFNSPVVTESAGADGMAKVAVAVVGLSGSPAAGHVLQAAGASCTDPSECVLGRGCLGELAEDSVEECAKYADALGALYFTVGHGKCVACSENSEVEFDGADNYVTHFAGEEYTHLMATGPKVPLLQVSFTVRQEALDGLHASAVSCEVVELVNSGSRAFVVNAPAQMNSMVANLTRTGAVLVQHPEPLLLLAQPLSGSAFLNTAPLDGAAIQMPLNATVAYTNGTVTAVTDVNCAVEAETAEIVSLEGCTLVLRQNHTMGSPRIVVNVTHAGMTAQASVSVLFPSSLTVEMADTGATRLAPVAGVVQPATCEAPVCAPLAGHEPTPSTVLHITTMQSRKATSVEECAAACSSSARCTAYVFSETPPVLPPSPPGGGAAPAAKCTMFTSSVKAFQEADANSAYSCESETGARLCVENCASGKSVRGGGGMWTGGSAPAVTDGLNASTTGPRAMAECAAPAWVEVDLNGLYGVGSIVVHLGTGADDATVYCVQRIETSTDGVTFVSVYDSEGGYAPAPPLGRVAAFDERVVRYVRHYAAAAGGQEVEFSEVEVFGDTGGVACPGGWLSCGARCYQVLSSFDTQPKHEAQCAAMAPAGWVGHLASFTSARELNCVASVCQRECARGMVETWQEVCHTGLTTNGSLAFTSGASTAFVASGAVAVETVYNDTCVSLANTAQQQAGTGAGFCSSLQTEDCSEPVGRAAVCELALPEPVPAPPPSNYPPAPPPMPLTGSFTLAPTANLREAVARTSAGFRAYAAGVNEHGQLGDGGLMASETLPVETMSAHHVAHVAAGARHTVFITAMGEAFAVGANGCGQLGDGTVLSRTVPVRVMLGFNVTAAAAGKEHTLFLTHTGTVFSAGCNAHGQLGDGTTMSRASPVPMLLTNEVVQLSAGSTHSLMIASPNGMYACGSNAHGELIDRHLEPSDVTTPVYIDVAEPGDFASAGDGFSLVLFVKTGEVFAAGRNDHGQIGNGQTSHNATQKMDYSYLNGTAVSVAAGGQHALAVTSNGDIIAWGDNSHGQLGDPSLPSTVVTPTVVVRGESVTQPVAGNTSSLLVRSDPNSGAPVACLVAGRNAHGQFGMATDLTDEALPWTEGFPGQDVTAASAGAEHVVVMTYDHCLDGSLNGDEEGVDCGGSWCAACPAGRPASCAALTEPAACIASSRYDTGSGQLHPCAWDCSAASASCVEVSDEALASASCLFSAVGYRLPGVSPVSTGSNHVVWGAAAAAAGATSTAECPAGSGVQWACEAEGADHAAMVQLSEVAGKEGRTCVVLSAGAGAVRARATCTSKFQAAETQRSCGHADDPCANSTAARVATCGAGTQVVSCGCIGTVADCSGVGMDTARNRCAGKPGANVALVTARCASGWQAHGVGNNTLGQLGDGSDVSRTASPVQPLLRAPGVASLAAAGSEVLLLTSCGEVFGAGGNALGSLGDGTRSARHTPARVHLEHQVAAVSISHTHSLFVTADGLAFAAGDNSEGALGSPSGSLTRQLTPVPVGALAGVVAASAGHHHSLFLVEGGWAYGCGRNSERQLGIWDAAKEQALAQDSSPVLMDHPEERRLAAVFASWHRSMVISTSGEVYVVGLNGHGELGTGDGMDATAAFVRIMEQHSVVAIAQAQHHSIFVTAEGKAYGSGRNLNGELGDGTVTQRYSPMPVDLAAKVVVVATSDEHSVFVSAGGAVYVTGTTGYTAGPAAGRVLSPVEVMQGHGVTAAAAGTGSTYFIGALEPMYQSREVFVTGEFRAGPITMTMDVTCEVALESSDPSVVQVKGSLAQAVGDGSARLSAGMTVGGAVKVAVGGEEVETVALHGVLPTGAEWEYLTISKPIAELLTMGQVPYGAQLSLTGEARLVQSLTTEGASGPLIFYAETSDGAVQEVGTYASHGLQAAVEANFTDSLQIAGSALAGTLHGYVPDSSVSGDGPMVQATWENACTRTPAVTGHAPVTVTLIPAVAVRVTATHVRLASSNDPAAAAPVSLPEGTAVTVVIQYADGRELDVSEDARTSFSLEGPAASAVEVAGNVVTVITNTNGSVALRVRFTDFPAAAHLSGAVNLTLVQAAELQLFSFFGSGVNTTQLQKLQCTDVYQMCGVSAWIALTDGALVQVSSQADFTVDSSSALLVVDSNGIVLVAYAPGTAEISGQWEGFSKTLTVTVTDTSAQAVSAAFSTYWGPYNTFNGERGAVQPLSVHVTFDDGDVFYGEFGEPSSTDSPTFTTVATRLLNFSSSVQEAIGVPPKGGNATLLGNHHETVSIMAQVVCGVDPVFTNGGQDLVSDSQEVFSNLEPGLGDADLGMAQQLQLPRTAAEDLLQVQVRVHAGQQRAVLAVQLLLEFDPALLRAESCTPAAYVHGYMFDCGLNDPLHQVLIVASSATPTAEGGAGMGWGWAVFGVRRGEPPWLSLPHPGASPSGGTSQALQPGGFHFHCPTLPPRLLCGLCVPAVLSRSMQPLADLP